MKKLEVNIWVTFIRFTSLVLADSNQMSINFKRTFWYAQFSQKTNEIIQLHHYDTSGRLVFVRFLGEIEDKKRHFEIN